MRLAHRRDRARRVTKHWWAKAFWIAWPAWVWFAVMATGNHFWLDCLAGIGVALIAMAIVYRRDGSASLPLRRAGDRAPARTA